MKHSDELQAIFDSVPAMIFYKNRENRLLRVNKAFCEIMGMRREDLENKQVSRIFPREQVEAFWKDDLEVIRSGKPKTGIIEPIRTKKGNRWVQTDKIPYRDPEGNIIGIIGFAIDITKRREAELESARMKIVEAERQRLYALLETLPVYVILLAPDYHVTFTNKFFRDRFGEDKGLRCFEYLFNLKSPCGNCQTYKVLKTGVPHHWEWLGPDGRNYDIYDLAFKERDGSTHILEMGIDVTEQRRSQKALLDAQKEIEQAKRLSDIGTLAATVAHELRNPLAAISIAASNIKRKAQNPLLDKNLENISKKIAESDQIINNLLLYSRIRPPNYEEININRIINECVGLAQKHYREGKKISFVKKIDPTRRVPVKADSLQIREVLNNVLINSCDALPESEGRIEILTADKKEHIEVIIKDNGHGIEDEDLGKIFEPFFTTKTKGTGLGLTVCRQIIALHGGSIRLESRVGKGTDVYISLPKKGKINESQANTKG